MAPPRPLSRRQLLRASGFSIALPALASLGELPFLEAAEGTGEAGKQAEGERGGPQPRRFCCIFFPNGVSLPPEEHPAHGTWHWFPHQVGPDYQLTRSLEPLAQLRSELTILSGLSHPPMRSSIAHITADSFLTGADSSQEYRNSISLDQWIARRIGDQTRFPSLTLSSDGGVGTPGRTQTLSFTASGRPIPSLSEPRAIFNRLFGVTNRSSAEQRQAFGRDRSILDHVLQETRALALGLAAEDRARLEEYATSIREIEQRLARADRWLDVAAPAVDAQDLDLTAASAGDAAAYIRVILDLITVAFQTDSTRAVTYQITSEDAKGIGDRFPVSLGLAAHHALSHGTGKPQGFEDWARYDQFLAKQLAYFLGRLQSTQDPFGTGTLLDNTLVLYGGSTSRTHLARNYPLILAGAKNLGFSHGAHRRFDEERVRLSDLFQTLLAQLGVAGEDRFADSQRTLPELLAG